MTNLIFASLFMVIAISGGYDLANSNEGATCQADGQVTAVSYQQEQ